MQKSKTKDGLKKLDYQQQIRLFLKRRKISNKAALSRDEAYSRYGRYGFSSLIFDNLELIF